MKLRYINLVDGYDVNCYNNVFYRYWEIFKLPSGIYRGGFLGLYFYNPFYLIKNHSSGITIDYFNYAIEV